MIYLLFFFASPPTQLEWYARFQNDFTYARGPAWSHGECVDGVLVPPEFMNHWAPIPSGLTVRGQHTEYDLDGDGDVDLDDWKIRSEIKWMN